MYKEYERLHPNITIKEDDTELEANYRQKLQTQLAGGGGVNDIQGIDVGRIATVVQTQSDKFVDLNTLGATLVFSQLFGRDYGLINWVIGSLGFHHIDWQSSTWPSQLAVSTIVIWRWTGYNTLIYLAGMQSISTDLYEAAAVDGASRWRQFLNVTIPGLRPTILFTIIVSTIGATQLFCEPLLYEGGPTGVQGGVAHQYQTLGLYLYQQGWSFFHLGRAAAIAWAMVIIIHRRRRLRPDLPAPAGRGKVT